ncbi:hypothetical protein [Gaetbulibacter aestuarii]|uniref:Uncharacterized protein n=1 Tax=Gaetbulibacter aestuarii TaxID=1502358 RepID=A0ABW7MXS4_9FLAO
MSKSPVLLNLNMILIAFSVAIYTLGFTYFSLIIAFYAIIISLNSRFSKDIFLFLFLCLIPGALIGLWVVLFGKYDSIYDLGILYRIRFFCIRIFFAFAVFIYLSRLDYTQVLKFVYYIAFLLAILGLFQVISNPFDRITMLSSEPSAAGMYYVFLAPLLLIYYDFNKRARPIILLYLIIGIFIRSKAQILVIPFYLFYFVFKSNNKKLKRTVLFLIIITLLLTPMILKIKELQDISSFLDVLFNQGIKGLTEKNKIWSTFTLRFSSILTAIQMFIENPFGSGFGTFHPEYITKMTSSENIQSFMTGIEISKTLNNELYATPKSIFFEYLVSSGLFFLLPLFYVLFKFHKTEKSNLIKSSLYGLVLVSMMVELAPFMVFIIVLLVLHKKGKKFNNKITSLI